MQADVGGFHVKWFGKKEANPMEITVVQYKQTWDGTPHVLLDVREEDEWSDGHAPHAVWIPLGELQERVGDLDKTTPVAVICHSGRRSLMAAEFLKETGFANPVSITGGMVSWAGHGQPVVR